MTAAVPVTIPGGYLHEGTWRRELWLKPWSGRDEMSVFEHSAGALPATLCTALLGGCVSLTGRVPAGRAFVMQLTVGDREALLLHLRRMAAGDRLSCVVKCHVCAEPMDLDLRISELLLPAYAHDGWDHEAILTAAGKRYRIVFRLPNGEDQERAAAEAGDDEAVSLILRRCVRSLASDQDDGIDAVDPALASELSRVMAGLDPQAELFVDCRCPSCGAPLRSLFDAAHYVLREVSLGTEALFREIHAVANHFHWREADILAMSARKRRRYVALIEQANAGRRK